MKCSPVEATDASHPTSAKACSSCRRRRDRSSEDDPDPNCRRRMRASRLGRAIAVRSPRTVPSGRAGCATRRTRRIPARTRRPRPTRTDPPRCSECGRRPSRHGSLRASSAMHRPRPATPRAAPGTGSTGRCRTRAPGRTCRSAAGRRTPRARRSRAPSSPSTQGRPPRTRPDGSTPARRSARDPRSSGSGRPAGRRRWYPPTMTIAARTKGRAAKRPALLM